MIKRTGINVWCVFFNDSKGKESVIGCFRSLMLTEKSEALQQYFVKKYGKAGPPLSKCKLSRKPIFKYLWEYPCIKQRISWYGKVTYGYSTIINKVEYNRAGFSSLEKARTELKKLRESLK